jgi:hypothetical protein
MPNGRSASVPGKVRLTSVQWVELMLATIPATVLVVLLVMLGSGAVAGLLFAAAAHAHAGDRSGLLSDLTVLLWLGGALLAGVWGVAALWLATLSGENAIWTSPRRQWLVILGLVAGVANAVYWLASGSSLRESPLYVYPLVMASLAGLRNLFVLTVGRPRH